LFFFHCPQRVLTRSSYVFGTKRPASNPDNFCVIPTPGVSSKHFSIEVPHDLSAASTLTVTDLQSRNGTHVIGASGSNVTIDPKQPASVPLSCQLLVGSNHVGISLVEGDVGTFKDASAAGKRASPSKAASPSAKRSNSASPTPHLPVDDISQLAERSDVPDLSDQDEAPAKPKKAGTKATKAVPKAAKPTVKSALAVAKGTKLGAKKLDTKKKATIKSPSKSGGLSPGAMSPEAGIALAQTQDEDEEPISLPVLDDMAEDSDSAHDGDVDESRFCVLLTGFSPDLRTQYETIVLTYGGSVIAESISSATDLRASGVTVCVAPVIATTGKLLSAVALGVPLVPVAWLDDCQKAEKLLDFRPYDLKIVSPSLKVKQVVPTGYSPSKVAAASKDAPIFESCTILITDQALRLPDDSERYTDPGRLARRITDRQLNFSMVCEAAGATVVPFSEFPETLSSFDLSRTFLICGEADRDSLEALTRWRSNGPCPKVGLSKDFVLQSVLLGSRQDPSSFQIEL
jgi:hypothetical protein